MSKSEEIIEEYIEKFGGYPAFLLMGISKEKLISMMMESIKTGIPIKAEYEEGVDY